MTMAQALFKSWFVDFDPVRAKMEGSVVSWQITSWFASESSGVFSPTQLMVRSETRASIPEGWKVDTFNTVAEQFRLSKKIQNDLLPTGRAMPRHLSIPANMPMDKPHLPE